MKFESNYSNLNQIMKLGWGRVRFIPTLGHSPNQSSCYILFARIWVATCEILQKSVVWGLALR
jgi:hypothetical protein